MDKLKFITSHLATVAWNIMFGYGLLSIIYGYWTSYTCSSWIVLDTLVKFLGFTLTIFSVILTCSSIYIRDKNNKPSLLSKYVSAPAVISLMLGIAIEAVTVGRYPHEAVVAGASLIGLSGALHQMIPRLHEKGHSYFQGP